MTIEPVSAVVEGLQLLCERGSTYELRVPKAGRARVISGYFDDLEKMSAAATKLSGRFPGIYFTANPVLPALLARAQNRTIEYAEPTTSDDAVDHRRWLILDLDPNRPAGISASDVEHEAAIQRAREIAGHLQTQGWPLPMAMDSGNGCYLLYRIQLANNEISRELIRRCLESLAFHFDDDQVHVDQTMFNAARIIRTPGTLNAKGDNTPDRPHRICRVLSAGSEDEVSEELLNILSGRLPEEPTPDSLDDFWATKEFDLPGFVRGHLETAREGSWSNGGYRWVLKTCPFNSDHTDLSAWVGRRSGGAIVAGCQHNSCRWDWRELRARFEPEAYSRNGSQTTVSPPAFDRPAQLSAGGAVDHGKLTVTPVARSLPWPEALGEAAYHGLTARITKLIEPYVESNQASVLIQFLSAFGVAAGLHPHLMVGATRHAPTTYVGLVGPTSLGRKGTAWDPVETLFRWADPNFAQRILSGIGSGERLVWLVRDRSLDAKGAINDDGAKDRRLLLQEPELARLLTVVNREGSTLSAYLRSAYDGKPLRNEVKTGGSAASRHHIGLVGHCTTEELRDELSEQQVRNGLANRVIWILARREKKLSEPPVFEGRDVEEASEELAGVLERAHDVQRLERSEASKTLWHDWYTSLPDDAIGVVGAITARAATQVARFSMIYALTDGMGTVEREHLEAAIALWNFSVRCVHHIWGTSSGDVIADRIFEELAYGPLTMTQLYSDVFHRNVSGPVLERAVKLLEARGVVVRERVSSGGPGRPALRVRRIT